MAFYVEKPLTPFFGVGLLIFAFLACFQPWQLHFAELTKGEGLYAAAALEMDCSKPPVFQAHKVILNNYPPAAPWLTGMAAKFLPVETALRIWPLVALIATALIGGFAAKNVLDSSAGFTACAMILTASLVLEKFTEFNPLFCAMPFMLGGWLLWFYCGYQRSSWNRAWAAFALCAGLGAWFGGYRVLPLMIIPLIFMRRPLSIKNRFKGWGILILPLILGVFAVLRALPGVLAGGPLFDWARIEPGSFEEYGWQLLSFPAEAALRFMPWSLLAWAPFCVACQWIAPAPIFGKFLRTITITLFFLIWLTPGGESADMVIIIPPLAVLTGIYACYPVRRYGTTLIQITRLAAAVISIAALGILALYLWHPLAQTLGRLGFERPFDFLGDLQHRVFFGVSALAVFCSAAAIFHDRGRMLPVWAQTTLLVSMYMLCHWGIAAPYSDQVLRRHELGFTVAAAVTPVAEENQMEPLVYKFNINDLYTEAIYSGLPFAAISSLDELPEDAPCSNG